MSAQAQEETLLCTVDCKFNRTETKECELIECIICVGKFHHSCVGVDVKKIHKGSCPCYIYMHGMKTNVIQNSKDRNGYAKCANAVT